MNDALHLERLSDWLKTHAKNPYGRERLASEPHSHGLELERRMDAAQAWCQILSDDDGPDLGLDSDCRPALQHLTRGGVLNGEELYGIRRLLEVLCTLHRNSETYPSALRGLTSALGAYDDEWERLRVSVAEDGTLLDTASSKLGELKSLPVAELKQVADFVAGAAQTTWDKWSQEKRPCPGPRVA